MNCYLISYDLLTANKDYEPLYAKIKSLGAWWHHLQSVWVVTTSLGIKEVSDQLKETMDDRDSLLVIDIRGKRRRGWLTERAWAWLDRNNPVQREGGANGNLQA